MSRFDEITNTDTNTYTKTDTNNVNIDIALEAKKKGMKVIAYGSAAAAKGKQTRHSCGKTIFDIADIVVDTCAPLGDASVDLKNHADKVGPVSTMAFITQPVAPPPQSNTS